MKTDILKTTARVLILICIAINNSKADEISCEEVLAACDEALVSEQAAHAVCEEVVKEKDKKIAADKAEVERQSAIANHSHVPIVVGTSIPWFLLLIFL